MSIRLEIKGVSKLFKRKEALSFFTLTAGEGECIALCGGNGAGKSTLLHIIAGISAPSEGTIAIDKIDLIKARKDYLSHLGYMPDEFFAQETLTVSEFLSFYAKLRCTPLKRVTEMIQLLGLEEKKYDMIKHLSKGMRQRLLFGQAVMGNPLVLILDEPTNGLDPYWLDIFIRILIEMKRKGTTVIFSTHMMDVAAELADRVIFMDNGKVMTTLKNDHKNAKQFTDKLLQLYRGKGKSIH